MASKLPPVHPYSIMLYQISQYLTGKKEKIIDLARIMGLRKFGTIDNVADLFDRLEDEGCLSEFKVTDLGKALDIIDLPEAARKVKEYEEQELEDKTSQVMSETPYCPVTDAPPPYQSVDGAQEQPIPPTEATADDTEESETNSEEEENEKEENEEEENEINSTNTAGRLPIKEEGLPVEKLERLIITEDFNKESETLPCPDKMPTKYRLAVSGKSAEVLPINEESLPVEKVEKLITEDFNKESETLPYADKKLTKSHTVSGKSSRVYPTLPNGIFRPSDK